MAGRRPAPPPSLRRRSRRGKGRAFTLAEAVRQLRFERKLQREFVEQRGHSVSVRIDPLGRLLCPALQLRSGRAGEPVVGMPRNSSPLRVAGTGRVEDDAVMLQVDGAVVRLPRAAVFTQDYLEYWWIDVPRDVYMAHLATDEEREVCARYERLVARGMDDQSLTGRYRQRRVLAYILSLLDSGLPREHGDDNDVIEDDDENVESDPDPPPDDPTSTDELAGPMRVGQAPGVAAYAHPAEVAVPA